MPEPGPGAVELFDIPLQPVRRPPRRLGFGPVRWGGKSELRRTVRRVTPGQGDLKESGTENIPPVDTRDVSAGKGEKVR